MSGHKIMISFQKRMNKVQLTANILFSGIGCQERGFENSGLFDLNVLTTSDINKESVLSYAAIHKNLTLKMVEEYDNYPPRQEMADYLKSINAGYDPDKNKPYDWDKLVKRKKKDLEKYWLAYKITNNVGDIRLIKKLPYADFWTISFPCTDISISGKMRGFADQSGTRSSLLWDNIRLLRRAKFDGTLPKFIMIENVKNLVGSKFINDFNDLLGIFDEIGFNTYWKVLNGKDCGVPQNRERVFLIAIRKDIDSGSFEFPQPFDNGIRLRDILEEEVDEKYYLGEDKIEPIRKELMEYLEKNKVDDNSLHQIGYINANNCEGNRIYEDNTARTLKALAGGGGAKTGFYLQSDNELHLIENIDDRKSQGYQIYSDDYSKTLTSTGGGWSGKTGSYLLSDKIGE